MFKETKADTMILHIDADAFFVACEVARLPELQGRPVIVGGERGIACAMSYEAKALGITRAMPVFEIKKRFPETVILPAHFDLYYAYQQNLVSFLRARFSRVEVYSIDECFIEVSGHELAFTDEALESLRKEIKNTLGISYSLGLARTKTLAKIASKKRKPSGSFVMTKEREKPSIENLLVSSIWGIGRRTSVALEKYGIKTISDLLFADDKLLERHFSLPILQTRDELLGTQRIKIESKQSDQKSLQVTRSFRKTTDISFVFSELSLNIEKLAAQLQEKNLVTNMITIWIKEIRHGEDRYHKEDKELISFTNRGSDFLSATSSLYEQIRALPDREYKGSGIYAHHLRRKDAVPKTLFEDENLPEEKDILSMLSISGKHGLSPLVRTSSLIAFNKRKEIKEEEDRDSHYLGKLPYPYLGTAS